MGLATKKAVDNNSVAPLVCGEAIQARHIIVGRGSPRPVLQQEARVITPLSYGGDGGGAVYLVAGGRGAEAPVLPKNSKKHRQQATPSNANHSRTVVSVPRPPAPILQQPK